MVSTAKKVAANQANAELSTGPRTEEGKARAAQNSVTHGLRAKWVVAPWEDREEFDRFAERMLACLGPADEIDRIVAEKIVTECWRIRRVGYYETHVLTAELKSQEVDREQCPALYEGLPQPNAGLVVRALLEANRLPKLSNYQQRIEGSLYRALKELEHLQKCRPAPRPDDGDPQ